MSSLKSIPKHLRPRERLEQSGVQALTTAELLTILLGSGTSKIPVQTLAKRIEQKLRIEKEVKIADLTEIKGIGLAKACQILAALELVERIHPRYPDEILNSLDKVLLHFTEVRYSHKEQIIGIYLDARMKLIHQETLAIGSVNQSIITPRDVFSPIKHHPIVYYILAHNHPSGDPQPSQEDITFTGNMRNAGKLLGVELLDHIIVAKEKHFSFREGGLM